MKLVVSASLFTIAAAMSFAQEEALPGAPEFAGALAQHAAYVLPQSDHETAGAINRALREAQDAARRSTTDEQKQAAAQKRAEAVARLLALLENAPATFSVDVTGTQTVLPELAPIRFPADTGALLFRVRAGVGAARAVVAAFDLSERVTPRFPVQVAPDTVTWVLLTFANVPETESHLELEFSPGGGPTTILPIRVATSPRGTVRVTVLSDDTGDPAPSMLRIERKLDGRAIGPPNALDFGPQFDHQGNFLPMRRANYPGPFAGQYWICPGPFTMQLGPGEYRIVVMRGAEHTVVTDDVTIASSEVVSRSYRPRRWINMRKRGWWSGDDHVHATVMSDDDAENLLKWAQAEDVNVSNVVKMGDIHRTWFQQRGFGPEYRVVSGHTVLSPGQECPRTHNELGHTIHMNIRNMVRDTDRYYLYDTVFDEVAAQGGLSGYCHVNSGIFHVHRDMTLNIPKGKVDFVELLQFANLGTDLYYDFLNLGFKVTASAGSDVPWGGSIGEVRLYAYLGRQRFTADKWFAAVDSGRTFVTSGVMLDLRVNKALPGDTLEVDSGEVLRVRAAAYGDTERALPSKLEIVVHGKVVKSVEATDREELSIEMDVPAEDGLWLAARAEGADASRAHTTPVYVVRDGLRFWNFDALPELLAKRRASLDEIEQIVADAAARNAAGTVDDNRPIKQLALQGPALLERVAAARALYDELERVAETERPLRAHGR